MFFTLKNENRNFLYFPLAFETPIVTEELNNFIQKRTYNMTYKTLIITAKTFYPIINTTTKLNHNAINEKIKKVKLPGPPGPGERG